MDIKLVIFDLDDTLYNEKNFLINGFKEVSYFLSNRTSISSNIFFNFLILDYLKNGRGCNFNSLIDKFQLNKITTLGELISIYHNNNRRLFLYNDAKTILEYLNNKCKIGLITDGNIIAQRKKLLNLGISKLFQKIIITDEYGIEYRKPNEKSYIDMLNYFKCEPKKSIYVGDNPNKDFIMAKKIGIYTVRILRGQYRNVNLSSIYDADFDVSDLTEIISIMNFI